MVPVSFHVASPMGNRRAVTSPLLIPPQVLSANSSRNGFYQAAGSSGFKRDYFSKKIQER
jgi:hypothetical protein